MYAQPPTEKLFAGTVHADGNTSVEDVRKFVAIEPTIVEYVKMGVSLPLHADDAKRVFSNQIDLIDSSRKLPVEQIDSCFVVHGILQTGLLVVGVAVRMTAPPTRFVCEGEDSKGNAAIMHYGSLDPFHYLAEAYTFQMVLQQRYMLINERLRNIVIDENMTVPEEPVPVSSYVAEANKVLEALTVPKFVAKDAIARPAPKPAMPSISPFRRFARPMVLERGIPLTIKLVTQDQDAHDSLLRSVSWNDQLSPKLYNVGRMNLTLELYGFELLSSWNKYFGENAKNAALLEHIDIPGAR